MAAAIEVHHCVPRCLLKLWDEANNGCFWDTEISEAWLEFTLECERWRVPVTVSRTELAELVKRSEVVLEREKHRLLHRNDFARWGARGGRTTLRRYGARWFYLLALRRWNRIGSAELDAARSAS